MMKPWALRSKPPRPSETEAALRDERDRLQAMLDAMPHMLVELDGDRRLVRCRAGWLGPRSPLPEPVHGQRFEDALPAPLARLARQVLDEVDEKGRSAGHEYEVPLADGRRWHSVSASRMPCATGGHAGYLVVISDTTEAHVQRQQVERLGVFAQLTSNLVIVTDAEQRIEWVNAAFETQTGQTQPQVRGLPLCAVMSFSDSDCGCSDRLREMLAGARPVRAELQATASNGRRFWLDLSIQPLLGPDGALSGYMAVGSDITAYKQQEQQLAAMAAEAQAARSRLAAAVEVLPDAFAYYDAEDRLVLCNAQYHDFHPRSSPAIVPGARFEEILRERVRAGEILDAHGREDEWMAERLAAHRQDSHEQEQQLADGRWLRVLERRTPDGGRVGLAVDITALKQAEQRARTDLATAMDASHDGIAITDPDGCYVYMNRAHREMFGFTDSEEIIGRSWRDLYAPEVADHIAAVAMPVLEAEGGWRGEVIGRRLDGSDLPQEVSLTLKADGGIICMSRNIAKRLREQQEQARLREELQMAQRREIIGQLASGLAHDLNNLLAAIGGSATLIRDLRPGAAEAHAQRIISATEQAGALVRRFLSLGQRQSNRSRIDLRALLHEAADLVRAGLRNRTRLTLALPPEPVWVEADPTDILQVVLNLVVNARDAIATAPPSEMGYEITLALGAPDAGQLAGPFAAGTLGAGQAYVALTVSDNGPGIAPETQAKVFQPYFSTKGAAGTGLGLAIVTGVLSANHGAIALASAPGAGTRFTVLWPIEARERPEAPAAPAPATAGALTGRLTGRTVLVVDDNADVLRVLSAFLEQAGAEVVPCADPRDALAALRDDPALWDLLVTDYDMPHVTGADLGQAANGLAPDLPVLLITALPDWRSRVTQVTPRFAAVLGKPLTRSDFLTAAEAAMRSAEAAEAVG
ncbi:hybrid sensor histidine kinase/response regulator [Cereibacter sediminicola]|uniref:hybrid sensor histidine kinase/response regulator n=1 Tax=Cereibacter sediminicola TaxID=2584941 RepID=UPI0011AB14D5|nr:PAS domain S-box protein [Cereibacter sediminicola]